MSLVLFLRMLVAALKRWFKFTFSPRVAVSVEIHESDESTEVSMAKQSTIRNTGKRTLHASFKDKDGNPARVDGVPKWTSRDPDLLTVHPAEDGRTCVVRATGGLPEPEDGVVTITVEADADIGTGVKNISNTVDYTIIDANAKLVEIGESDEEDNEELGGG